MNTNFSKNYNNLKRFMEFDLPYYNTENPEDLPSSVKKVLDSTELALVSFKNLTAKSSLESDLSILIWKGMSVAIGFKANCPFRIVVPSDTPNCEAIDKFDVF